MTQGGRGRAAGVQGEAASTCLDGLLGVTGEEFYYGKFTHQWPFPSPFVVSAPRAENTMCRGSRTVAKKTPKNKKMQAFAREIGRSGLCVIVETAGKCQQMFCLFPAWVKIARNCPLWWTEPTGSSPGSRLKNKNVHILTHARTQRQWDKSYQLQRCHCWTTYGPLSPADNKRHYISDNRAAFGRKKKKRLAKQAVIKAILDVNK